MFRKNLKAVKISRRRVNGKLIPVITLVGKTTVRDLARAAAAVNHANDDYADEPWLGHGNSGTGYVPDDIYGSNQSSNGNSNGSSFLEKLGGFVSKNEGIITKALGKTGSGSGNADTSGGKAAGNILSGLAQDFVAECVRKYKAGESLTEFERRVAMAAIALENEGKKIINQKIADWIADHLLEIGLGVLGLIVVVGVISRR